MVISGGKLYNSFEELGNDILASLPKEKQRVKWWKGWSFSRSHYTNCLDKTMWQHIKVWLPHISKSRSWVGYLFLHVYLCNRWCILFTCGHYEFRR